MLEGKDQNREVLGLKEHPRRSLIRLVKMDDNLKVTYGLIHGLTKGSILAVYPPAGAKGNAMSRWATCAPPRWRPAPPWSSRARSRASRPTTSCPTRDAARWSPSTTAT